MNSEIFKNFIAWFVWLLLLILWNYSFPKANPLEDVMVSIAIAMVLRMIQRYFLKY